MVDPGIASWECDKRKTPMHYYYFNVSEHSITENVLFTNLILSLSRTKYLNGTLNVLHMLSSKSLSYPHACISGNPPHLPSSLS